MAILHFCGHVVIYPFTILLQYCHFTILQFCGQIAAQRRQSNLPFNFFCGHVVSYPFHNLAAILPFTILTFCAILLRSGGKVICHFTFLRTCYSLTLLQFCGHTSIYQFTVCGHVAICPTTMLQHIAILRQYCHFTILQFCGRIAAQRRQSHKTSYH